MLIQRSYKKAEDVIALISKCQLALDKGLAGTICFSDQSELRFGVHGFETLGAKLFSLLFIL